MDIWISVLPGYGHLFPTLPLARALADAGHTVTYCSSPRFKAAVEEQGFEHLPVGLDYTLDGKGSAFDDLGIPPEAVEMIMFVEGPIVVATDLIECFRSAKPDVMLVDPVEFGAMTACEAAGVPWGCFVNGVRTSRMVGQLPFDKDKRASVVEQMHQEPGRRRREAVGLGPSGLDPAEAPYDRTLALMMAPPSLEAWPLDVLSHTGHHLRPEVHASDAEDLSTEAGSGRPLVVITFGTLFGTKELYERAAVAALDGDNDVVVVTGESLDIKHDRFFTMRWASMDRLLDRADAVVHHGGWGSTVGALATGTPSVVIPLGAEQPTNAARIASVGAGVWVDAGDIESELMTAIRTVLEDPVYRLNAERLRREIESMPTAAEVVPIIERLAMDGPPVLRS
jgi:UDP:flavonoid glycosyltransferase YjiC (YdhE family)